MPGLDARPKQSSRQRREVLPEKPRIEERVKTLVGVLGCKATKILSRRNAIPVSQAPGSHQ